MTKNCVALHICHMDMDDNLHHNSKTRALHLLQRSFPFQTMTQQNIHGTEFPYTWSSMHSSWYKKIEEFETMMILLTDLKLLLTREVNDLPESFNDTNASELDEWKFGWEGFASWLKQWLVGCLLKRTLQLSQ